MAKVRLMRSSRRACCGSAHCHDNHGGSLGAVPLALDAGTGSELRRPLGIAIIGGLIFSQLLTLYTTPVVYLYLDRLALRFRWRHRGRLPISCAGRIWRREGERHAARFNNDACSIALLTHACTVGPKYIEYSAPVPPNYKEPPPDNYKESDDWKQAHPQDDALRGKWWEIFGDPQLNALEEQVAISNQNVAFAEAQFRAARAAIRAARADLFPVVTAGAAATASRGFPNRLSLTGVTSGTGRFYQLPIDLNYEADVWGRVRNTVNANIANAQASAADLETVRLTSTAELALDYFALRGLDEEQRLFQASIAAFEQALQLTNNRYNQGIASASMWLRRRHNWKPRARRRSIWALHVRSLNTPLRF